VKNDNTIWVISGGRIPLSTAESGPEFNSRDWLSILNSGVHDAAVRITIFHADKKPTGPFNISIAAKRIKKIRMNDLVDPEPITLEEDYAAVIESDMPLAIQFSRMDTTRQALALLSTLAFPCDDETKTDEA
jgi:hypothetical protein